MCCVLTYLSESFLGLLKNISLFVSSNFGMQWEKQKPAFNKTQKRNEKFGITGSEKKGLILGNSSKVHTGTPIAFHLTMYPSA